MNVALQTGIALQGGSVTEVLLRVTAQLLGLGVAVGTVSGLVALGYRWYVRERVPSGLAVLFGLTVVALYLGSTTALGQVIGGQEDVLQLRTVLPNLAAFAVGGVASYAGLRLGDRLGTDFFVTTGGRQVDADVSEIVQTVGRVTSVKLPDEVGDIVGYDPMPDATKETLAGKRFLFPRRLTRDELRERLVSRLKTDYGVGHVDVEFADDGSVTFLAIGSRAAGIGPTLPPSTNAVAITADPANAASAGDLVQVWATDPSRRVLTGELRGIVGDVVTVAIDAAETPKLDPSESYRLVTLPVEDRPDREFASLLRAADETMGTATVGHGSTLDGATVGSVDAAVVAVTRDGEHPRTIPTSSQTLAAGDVLYLIARPEVLRRVEAACEGTNEAPDVEPGQSETGDTQPTEDLDSPSAGDNDGSANRTQDESATEPPVASQQSTELAAEPEAGGSASSEHSGTSDPGEGPSEAEDDGDRHTTESDAGERLGDGTDGTPDDGDLLQDEVDEPDDDDVPDDDADEPNDGDLLNDDVDDLPDEGTADEPADTPDDASSSPLDPLRGDDVDDFLSTSDGVEVWDPDERLADDEDELFEDDADGQESDDEDGDADDEPTDTR